MQIEDLSDFMCGKFLCSSSNMDDFLKIAQGHLILLRKGSFTHYLQEIIKSGWFARRQTSEVLFDFILDPQYLSVIIFS